MTADTGEAGWKSSLEQDHYAVLGIAPTADQAAIRSAYRTLMRRFHPDADSSDEAAAQARAINLAYAALGDPGRRSTYDSAMGLKAALKFEPVMPRKAKKGWPARLGSAAAIGVALVAAIMVAYALIPRDGQQTVDRGTVSKQLVAPRPTEVHIVAKSAETKPLVTAGPVSATNAVSGAAPQTAVSPRAREDSSKPKTKTSIVSDSVPQANPAASRCSGITKRAERMVCNDENLASLDRQLSLLYRQSWSAANERKRTALLGTRQIFNDRRDECETPNCLTSAYVVRLKEISDIMAGRPPR